MWKKFLELSVLISIVVLYQNCGNFKSSNNNSSLSSNDGEFYSSAENPFSCSGGSTLTPSDQKRLTKNQYLNVLRDLFGNSVNNLIQSEIGLFPDENYHGNINGYISNYDKIHIDTFNRVAKTLGAAVSDGSINLLQINIECLRSGANSNLSGEACQEHILDQIGKRFFRRPLLPEETKILQEIYTLTSNHEESLGLVVQFLLQSPQFLYKVETGQAQQGTDTEFPLTAYEVANRLSFLLWDSMPDSELFAFAEKDEILNPNILSQQYDRMVKSPLAKDKVKDFLMFWLEIDPNISLPTGPTPFIGNLDTTNLEEELLREMGEYYAYMLYESDSSFSDLVSSDLSFARTPASASIYGHSPVSGSSPATMNDLARGLFLRSPMMFGSTNQTSPILRGVKFRKQVLCDQIPTPPPGTFQQGPDTNTLEMLMNYSTRERTNLKTGSGSCFSCHQLINPVGFAFENFDSFGRFRDAEIHYDENDQVLVSHTIDSSGSLPALTAEQEAVAFNSPEEFRDFIANSTQAKACYTKNLYRFYKMRMEDEQDTCALSKMYEHGAMQSNSLEEFSKSLLFDYQFFHRKTQ